MIITPGEVAVGMYITIMEWTEKQYTSGIGAILRVEALSLPFLACKGPEGVMISLDTRELRISPLTDEYVKAMLGEKGGETTPLQWNCRCALIRLEGDVQKETPED